MKAIVKARSRNWALALLLLAALVVPPTAVPASADELSPAGLRALEEITGCLQAKPLLAVTIVIDESASLKTVDPTDSRAEILGQFLRRIASFSDGTIDEKEREVYVNIGYFGTTYNEWLPWTALDESNSEPIVRDAIAETARRKEALHTRHSFAIDDSRKAIESISARLPARDLCTMVVWFSDGELDPENNPRGAPDRPAVLEATDELCRPGGLLDQLRETGAPLVGIMLDSEFIDRSGQPIPRKREMVEGDGPGGECGVRPANGVYLQGELDTLFRMFERVAAESEGATRLGAFAGDPIDIPVDGGVGRIRIVGPAENGFELTSPSGRFLETADGAPLRGDLAGDAISTWTGGSFSLDVLVRKDYGTWRLVRTEQGGEIDVYYFGDLEIIPDLEATSLLRGEPSRVAGAIGRLDGSTVELGEFTDIVMTIDAGAGPQEVEVAADGSFRAEVDVVTEEALFPVSFRLVATTQRGIVLQPVVRQLALPVTLPEEFPRVEFASGNRFDPQLQQLDDRSAVALELIGSSAGQTRVCVTGADATELLSIGLAAETSDGCIDLAPDERREVMVTAQIRELSLEPSLNEVVITTRLTSAPIEGRGSLELTKILRADASIIPPPPNEWVRWFLFLLGILVPLGVLMLANHRAARFSTRDLQAAQIPVVLQSDETMLNIRRDDASGLLLLDDKDFTYLPVDANGSRHIPLGVADLRTRTPMNPFGSIRAEVVAAAGKRVMSNREPATTAEGTSAGMDLMPQRDTFLVIDDTALRGDPDSPVPATLVSFLTPTVSGDAEQLGRVIDDIGGKLVDPSRLAQLREAAAQPQAESSGADGSKASRRSKRSAGSEGSEGSAPPSGTPVVMPPPVGLGDGFGDGFDDGFGPSPSSPAAPSPAPASPSTPPTHDPDDAAWGSTPTGSDDIWD